MNCSISVIGVLLIIVCARISPVWAFPPQDIPSGMVANGSYVDIKLFANLSSAKASPQTSGKTILITNEQKVGNLVIPRDRGITVLYGGCINVDDGKRLTIYGPFSAGNYQAFNGDGRVSFAASSLSTISPTWFYDGSDNWGPAINRAIQSAMELQQIDLPAGNLTLKGTGTEIILIDRMLKIIGKGVNATKFILSTNSGDIGNQTAVIRVSPNMVYGYGGGIGLYLSDFTILSADGSTKVANCGIYLDTTARDSQIIAESLIERIHIYPVNGPAIYQADGPTSIDGYFNSVIRNCMLFGGITMRQMGDTNRIENNFLRGDGYGLDLNMTYGSSLLRITGNVVTSASGSIIRRAGSILVDNNQFEGQVVNTGADGALLAIKGNSHNPVSLPIITNNKFYHRVFPSATYLLVDYCIGPQISGNYFSMEFSKTQTAIKITHNCVGADLKENLIIKDAAPAYSSWRSSLIDKILIQDFGIGTVGLTKTIKLLNGWEPHVAPPTAEKCDQEWVKFHGELASGIKLDGTELFILPVGFRPLGDISLNVVSTSSVYPWKALLELRISASSGSVKLYGADNNTKSISLVGVSFKSNTYYDIGRR